MIFIRYRPARLVPEIHPGESLGNGNIGQHADGIDAVVSCTIEIRNFHRDLRLSNPGSYSYAGVPSTTPQRIIRPGFAEVCSFRKESYAFGGTAGVLTYDFEPAPEPNERVKVVIMWSVPLMVGLYWHGIGIGSSANIRSHQDQDLFNEMYNGSPSTLLNYEHGSGYDKLIYDDTVYRIPLRITATFNPRLKAQMVVEIR
jgi:hypothetical protein